MVIIPPSASTTRWFLGRSFLANDVSELEDESVRVLPISLFCQSEVDELELMPGTTRGMIDDDGGDDKCE